MVEKPGNAAAVEINGKTLVGNQGRLAPSVDDETSMELRSRWLPTCVDSETFWITSPSVYLGVKGEDKAGR